MWTRTDSRMREYQALPLFEGCTRSQLRQASRAATRLSPGAGTVLVRQGARLRPFVIVVYGTAEVWRDGQPIDEIGAGGYFGEIALVRRIREPASVVACTAMTVDVIPNREFAALYADLALVRERLDNELDRRLAKWIPASDARSPYPATALPLPLPLSAPAAVPTSTDDHHAAPEPASLARLRRAGARRMAISCDRRARR